MIDQQALSFYPHCVRHADHQSHKDHDLFVSKRAYQQSTRGLAALAGRQRFLRAVVSSVGLEMVDGDTVNVDDECFALK